MTHHLHTARRTTAALALGAAVAATLAGCGDSFTTGPALTVNPNNPTEASPDLLFAGAQASLIRQQTGQLARTAGMVVQQLGGIGRQQQSYMAYQIVEGDHSGNFSQMYTGGGLVDLRTARAGYLAAGDTSSAGAVLFLEAFTIGTGASLWGDIPYSEAVNPEIARPKLDPQQQVYATIQAKLDTAIGWLPRAGRGPATLDLFYNALSGNAAQQKAAWVAAANTLKARFHMHTVERLGNTALTSAVAAARNGIASPANDFRTHAGSAANENNLFFTFQNNRAGDLGAGAALVDLLIARNDPRLATGTPNVEAYFANAGGAAPNNRVCGATRNGTAAAPCTAVSNFSAARMQGNYRQRILTHIENQLILAEAQARLGQAADALTALNAAKTAAGVPTVTGLTGQALLDEIFAEKYIATFQTIEGWNDYKRNCFPRLQAPGSNTQILGRLLYGSAERQNNPNIPSVAQQQAAPRNWNDPNACS